MTKKRWPGRLEIDFVAGKADLLQGDIDIGQRTAKWAERFRRPILRRVGGCAHRERPRRPPTVNRQGNIKLGGRAVDGDSQNRALQ